MILAKTLKVIMSYRPREMEKTKEVGNSLGKLKRPAEAEAQPAAKRQKAVRIEKVVPEAAVCPSWAYFQAMV